MCSLFADTVLLNWRLDSDSSHKNVSPTEPYLWSNLDHVLPLQTTCDMASRELQLLRIAILSSQNFIISSTFGNFVSLDLDLSGTSLLLISLLTNGSCASDNWVISSEPEGEGPDMALAGDHIVVNPLADWLFFFLSPIYLFHQSENLNSDGLLGEWCRPLGSAALAASLTDWNMEGSYSSLHCASRFLMAGVDRFVSLLYLLEHSPKYPFRLLLIYLVLLPIYLCIAVGLL